MPKITNPVIISKIRKGLLAGKPESKVMLEAGLSKEMARTKVGRCKIVQVVRSRIEQELKESDVTVQLVLNNLYEDRRLALAKQDYATATRVDELLGKYRAMFTERIKSEATVSIDNQQSLYNRFQFLQVTPTQ